jgi:hypothetical protein
VGYEEHHHKVHILPKKLSTNLTKGSYLNWVVYS